MNDAKDKAKEYRKRADEIRLTVSRMSSRDSRNTLLIVATTYERLALSWETIARTDIARSDRNSKQTAED
jgi:MFS-type transporter involved in bile tolerance (Atg22 family)